MFLRGVTLVVTHHRAPKEVVVSLQKQVTEYLDGLDEGSFLKRAKFLLLQPMALLLKNEPPAAPAPFAWRGKFRKWMRARLVYTRKNAHLWFSFLQAKRAAAPVTESIILKTFEDHRQAMETKLPIQNEPGKSERVIREYMELMEPLLAKVADKLYKRLARLWRTPTHLEHVASSRASFESSRKRGGQLGALFRETFGEKADHEDPLRTLRRKDLRRLSYEAGRAVAGLTLGDGVLVEDSFYEGDMQAFEEMLAREWPKYAALERLDAQCQAVLEPFKVRTITKGPAVPYYLAKPLQKALHGILKEYPCFRLIGRPLQVTDLMDIAGASEWSAGERSTIFDIQLNSGDYGECLGLGSTPDLDEPLQWASVDYVSSTDKLWQELSAAYLGRCLARLRPLNPVFTDLMMKVLAPHRVTYPKVGDVQLPPVVQVNGQLMGSPLSFPILCLANAGLIMKVKREVLGGAVCKRGFWRVLSSMLINGDDALYKATGQDWSNHVAFGLEIGLSMSPGKAYLHRRYANVNSTSIDCDAQVATATPYLVKFLNTGLYFGQHKVLGEFNPDDPRDPTVVAPHISVIEEVWRGAWGSRECELLAGYLRLHSDAIRHEQKGRNLFIPTTSGGWGAAVPDGFKNIITPYQVSLAAGILKRFPYLVPDERPLPAGKVPRDLSGEVADPFRQPKLVELVHPRRGPMGLVRDMKFGFVPFVPAPKVPKAPSVVPGLVVLPWGEDPQALFSRRRRVLHDTVDWTPEDLSPQQLNELVDSIIGDMEPLLLFPEKSTVD